MELDDDNDSGGILRRAGSGPLAASAAALFALAAAVLAAYPHGVVTDHRVDDLAFLCGVVSAALAATGSACLAERARRRGEPFCRAMGRALMAVSAAALFALAAGAAWMAWRLVAVGTPGGSWFLFLLECDLPPLGFPAALLPVGACLALGRRGRAVAYVASALMAAAGLVVCARFAMRIPISELVMVDDSFRVTFSLAQSARAVAIYAAERLSAMAFGLGAALWMESRINETPARGEHLIDRRK